LEISAALEDLHDKNNASFLHNAICNFQFLITCFIMQRVLRITYTISKALQIKNIDIMSAMALIEITIGQLQNLRNEEEFKTIFNTTSIIIEKVGVFPSISRIVGTQS